MIQTKYNFTHDPLLRGMIASMQASEAITAFSGEAIEFGLGVVYDGAMGTQDSSRPKVALPSATGFAFLGVSKHTHKQNTEGNDGFGALTTSQIAYCAIGDDITVITRGAIVVYSEEAVDLGDPVFLRHTANGEGTASGQFRKSPDTANADQVPNARWAKKTEEAGLAVLLLNLP